MKSSAALQNDLPTQRTRVPFMLSGSESKFRNLRVGSDRFICEILRFLLQSAFTQGLDSQAPTLCRQRQLAFLKCLFMPCWIITSAAVGQNLLETLG